MAGTIMANAADEYHRATLAENPYKAAGASLPMAVVAGVGRAVLDMPMTKGLDSLFQMARGGSFKDGMASWQATIATGLIPKVAGTVNDVLATWLPETKAMAATDQALNTAWKQRVWAEHGTLPLRRDYLGRRVPAAAEGMNPWLVRFVDPRRRGAVKADKADQWVASRYGLSGDLRFIPSIPDRDRWFKADNGDVVTLTAGQWERLQKYTGHLRAQVIEDLAADPHVQSAPLEQQAQKAEELYGRMHQVARSMVLAERDGLDPVRAGAYSDRLKAMMRKALAAP
jgi:hypothetical protein